EGLVCMLRKRRDRCNQEGTEGASTSQGKNGEMTALEAKQEMIEKWKDNQRTPAAHKHLMEIARPVRKLDSKKLPGLQLLKSYPALAINEILVQELFVELDTDENKVRENWKKTMVPLTQYHEEKKWPFVDGTLEIIKITFVDQPSEVRLWFSYAITYRIVLFVLLKKNYIASSLKKKVFAALSWKEETLWILESIHLYNVWFKEVNREKRAARVLELFP
ncbi:Histidine--tRNA ligase, partial [Frankliniella fusca]